MPGKRRRHDDSDDTDLDSDDGPHVGTLGTNPGVSNPRVEDVKSAQSNLFLPPSLEDALNFSRESYVTPMTSGKQIIRVAIILLTYFLTSLQQQRPRSLPACDPVPERALP